MYILYYARDLFQVFPTAFALQPGDIAVREPVLVYGNALLWTAWCALYREHAASLQLQWSQEVWEKSCRFFAMEREVTNAVNCLFEDDFDLFAAYDRHALVSSRVSARDACVPLRARKRKLLVWRKKLRMHHVIKWTRPSARILYCKRRMRWERGYYIELFETSW